MLPASPVRAREIRRDYCQKYDGGPPPDLHDFDSFQRKWLEEHGQQPQPPEEAPKLQLQIGCQAYLMVLEDPRARELLLAAQNLACFVGPGESRLVFAGQHTLAIRYACASYPFVEVFGADGRLRHRFP